MEAQPRLSPQAWPSPLSAPTPADPSASPLRSAESSASCPPTAASPATVSSPSPRPSTASARSPTPSPTLPRFSAVIAGHDPLDATSSPEPVPDYAAELAKPVKGLKIGVPAEYFAEGLDPEVRAAVEAAIEKLRADGAEIRPISLPHTRYAVPAYYVLATAEASSNLARFDGVRYGYRAPDANTLSAMYRKSRDGGFGAEVKRRILLGTYALSAGYYDAYYKKAQQVRTLLTRDFIEAFSQVDAIVTPVAPTPAFKIGEKTDDPIAMYLADIYTVTASLAGICGISVPCGTSSDGLPIGAQILGKHFAEGTVFRVAAAVERP